MQQLWDEGNPFAWHLHLESKLIFASDGSDAIQLLGRPASYVKCSEDCDKFRALFRESSQSVLAQSGSTVFDLSAIFLSIRNFATCFSLGVLGRPNFSRSAALTLGKDSIRISTSSYRIFERARILCTRGEGPVLAKEEVTAATEKLVEIQIWMDNLMNEVSKNGRIQRSNVSTTVNSASRK